MKDTRSTRLICLEGLDEALDMLERRVDGVANFGYITEQRRVAIIADLLHARRVINEQLQAEE
jgi:hypothetical protein